MNVSIIVIRANCTKTVTRPVLAETKVYFFWGIDFLAKTWLIDRDVAFIIRS